MSARQVTVARAGSSSTTAPTNRGTAPTAHATKGALRLAVFAWRRAIARSQATRPRAVALLPGHAPTLAKLRRIARPTGPARNRDTQTRTTARTIGAPGIMAHGRLAPGFPRSGHPTTTAPGTVVSRTVAMRQIRARRRATIKQ